RTGAVVRAINESLEHLRPWMAWAAEPATDTSVGLFVATAVELWERRKDFGYSIVEAATDRVVGGCGLHGRVGRHGLEIGYWVHVDWAGRGVATAASRTLVEAAFGIDGIERVRVQCEDGNVRSARVPEKLGFRYEGIVEPADGPCAGRPTQIWWVERSAWIGGGGSASP